MSRESAFALGCVHDGPGDPPGVLEYEGPLAEVFRDGDRIEVVPKPENIGDLDPEGIAACGFLDAAAFSQLTSTLAGLDPELAYSLDPAQCGWADGLAGRVHLPGFRITPVACTNVCCHEALRPLPSLYFLALNEFEGTPIRVDGVARMVLDPDRSCD